MHFFRESHVRRHPKKLHYFIRKSILYKINVLDESLLYYIQLLKLHLSHCTLININTEDKNMLHVFNCSLLFLSERVNKQDDYYGTEGNEKN